MRHAARHEGAGAGAADRDLVADLEGDLAIQDIRHLVAVVMQVERALCPGGNGFLEHHDAFAGVFAQQFEQIGPAWFRCVHRSFLLRSLTLSYPPSPLTLPHPSPPPPISS